MSRSPFVSRCVLFPDVSWYVRRPWGLCPPGASPGSGLSCSWAAMERDVEAWSHQDVAEEVDSSLRMMSKGKGGWVVFMG